MGYTMHQKLVPPGLNNNPNRNMSAIKFITIHTTGNTSPTATAKMHADYQFSGSGDKQASWHYTVDAHDVWQSFEDNRMCWHAGDGNGPGNSSSIGIEICDNDRGNFVNACDNAAKLTAGLISKHGLSVDHIKQHYDWSGKNCPLEIRAGNWGITWAQFLERVRRYLVLPSEAVVDALKDTKVSAWSKEAWDWAVENGITDGTSPKEMASREAVITMIYRALRDK